MTEHDPAFPAAEPERPTPSPFAAAPADAVHPDGTVPSEPATATTTTTTTTTARRPARRAIAFGAAALVLLGIGAGGGALAATQLQGGTRTGAFGQSQGALPGGTSQTGTGTGQSGTGQSGTGQPFGFQSGVDPRGGFDPQGGTSSTSSSASTATAAQSVGVVTVTTTLGYQSASAAGTGVVLTSDGEILTNNHVIDGATSIRVTDETTNRTYTARVVGTDATHDVAVLRLQGASGLATAKLATSVAKVGDSVTAVGNAGGTGTLAAAKGTVTALKQSITTSSESGDSSENLTDLIETDADVVSGDSGGPLLNTSGQVVGIDTAASSGTRTTTGYAITIARARSIAATILAGTDTADTTIGYPAFLGVQVSATSSGTSGTSGASGATVGGVIPNTPAASTGLVAGDVITAVDGRSVASATALTARLHAKSPGDRVRITWTTAAGSTRTATVPLIAGPAD